MLTQLALARSRLLERQASLRRSLEPLRGRGSTPPSQWYELRDIEEALQRIERNEYGLCSRCEGPIGLQRLSALPETSHCTRCSSLPPKR